MADTEKQALIDGIYSGEATKIKPSWQTPSWGGADEFAPIDLENLEGLVETLADTAEAIQTAVDVAQPILGLLAAGDPISTAVNLLALTLNDTIDAILETGLYIYPIHPPLKVSAIFEPYPTDQALASIASSLIDSKDSERPQAPEESAYAGVVVLGGANTWPDLRALLHLLGNFMGDQSQWAKIGNVWEKFAVNVDARSTRKFRQSQGVPPNWYSWRLEEISAISDALHSLKAMINVTVGGVGEALANTIRIIRKRINYILRIIEEVGKLIAFLSIIDQIQARCMVLPIASRTGGVKGMAGDIMNAENKPDFAACAGFVAVGFAPDLELATQWTKFTELWGVTKEDFNRMAENVEQALADENNA